jgi:Tol biopolymer transport system component
MRRAMMTDERQRWSRVKEIFDTALASPPDRRATLVHDACRGDHVLMADVESLLAAHAAAGSFAEHAAIDALLPRKTGAGERHAPALTAGGEVGPYRILGPLDAGGMGEVYRALDTDLQRDVAIKVLPAALSDDPAWVARLEQEARLLAALNHPHIATVHGLERAGDLHAIVMELVEGPTLADRLARGPLPLDETLAIARQIADALEAAHEKGIIHRDLKPSNIKLKAPNTVKVLDFGLAQATGAHARDDEAPTDGARRTGVAAGTPAYMSPEQARGERLDARSDVWAFGCVVFEMLTAHQPFARTTVAGTLAALTDGEPGWERLPATAPLAIRRLLRRCLERDARRRLHHIADARIEIDEAADDREATNPPASSSRARTRVLVGSAIGIAGVLAAALGVWLWRTPASAPELRIVEITTPRTSDAWSFALSPDGRRLAFVADHDGRPALWVRALDEATGRALPGTEGARRPFWSPDSRSIGFFMNSDLKRIEPRGGSPQTVTYALAGMSAAWGPDGTILFSSTAARSLRRVPADGGPVEPATMPGTGSTGHRHPQFLPGGRQFLFFVGGPDAVRGVYLGSLESQEVTRLAATDSQGAYVAPGWLLFVRQGTLWAQRVDLERRQVGGEPIAVADPVAFEPIDGTAAFSTADAGAMVYRMARPAMTQLSWFDRSGNAGGTLGSVEQAGLTNLRLSPDGRRVVAERSLRKETDLWLLDGARQTRLTRSSDASVTRLPLWSPTGDRVAFQSIRPGSVAIAVKSSTGDGPEDVLFASPDPKIPCDWSPDGRFLVYYSPNPETGADLWVLSLETRVPTVFLRTDANELWGQFSPDGRWMAYQSNETGRYEIYVRPFPSGGGPMPISTAGGVYPRWSRDGSELYYIAPDAKMMAVAIRAASDTLEAGAPTALFETRRLGGGSNVIGRSHQYDVARDGRFLVNVDTQSSAPPLTLLLNWKPADPDTRP